MSKTKKILIGIILLTIVLLGIGYAAIQNVTLNIAGTATADPSQSNFIVRFTGTPEVSDSTKATAAITDDTNATINVEGLTASGEKVTATYTVQNASTDLSADLSVETTNSNEEYFTIDSELAKTSIVAGETTTLTVTVELIKTPISTTETSTIGIQLTSTPVQPGEEGTTNSGTGSTGGTTTSATLNEYGFYYGVPYSLNDGEDKISVVFFEDGSAIMFQNEVNVYELPEATYTYSKKSITDGETTIQVSDDGTEIGDGTDTATAELGVIILSCGVWGHSDEDGLDHTAVGCAGGHFKCEDACYSGWQVPNDGTYTLVGDADEDKTVYNATEVLPDCYTSQTGDVFVRGDYEYRYNQTFEVDEWKERSFDGWGTLVIDDTKTQYEEIYSNNINGKSVKSLEFTFANCKNLNIAPNIPNSVVHMWGTFAGCTNLKTYVGSSDADGDFSDYVIPEGVSQINRTFEGCILMTEGPLIPNSVWMMAGTFNGCTSLITSPTIPDRVYDMCNTFGGCTSLTTAPILPNSVQLIANIYNNCTNLKTYAGSSDADGDFSNYVIPTTVTTMSYAFSSCSSLTTAPVIPIGVTEMEATFYNCTSLTGEIQINTDKITNNDVDEYVTNNGYNCFYNTTKPIVLKGTGTIESKATLEVLAGTANNGNVTVE